MAQFFISYATADRKKARAIYSLIISLGGTCWMDCENIEPGASFPLSITQAIRNCQIFLLLFSPFADESEYVMDEVTLARKYKKRLVPLRLIDSEPKNLEFHLGVPQWIDLFTSEGEARLRRLVAEMVPQHSVPASAPLMKPSIDKPAEPPGQRPPQPERNQKSSDGQTFQQLRASAAAGDAESAWRVANAYRNGTGVLRSEADAIHWYEAGAKLGDPRCQYVWGVALLRGTYTREDPVKAAAWFARSAEQGSLDAEYQLAILHLQGVGVRRSEELALSKFRRCAEAGNAGAEYQVALMLSQGKGAALNLSEARMWAERAANRGHEMAARLLRDLTRLAGSDKNG